MKTPSLNDTYVITNALGNEIRFSAELMAWNNLLLIILTIASFMVMVNRLTNCNKRNAWTKVMFGGLGIVSLAGLLYPIELGLIGVNIVVTAILLIDFFKHDKNKCYGNRNEGD